MKFSLRVYVKNPLVGTDSLLLLYKKITKLVRYKYMIAGRLVLICDMRRYLLLLVQIMRLPSSKKNCV